MKESERIEFKNDQKFWTCAKLSNLVKILSLITWSERIPNRKDSDYFDLYENFIWKATPWYKRFFNFIYRFIYFIIGPKFIVPILGCVVKRSYSYLKLSPDKTAPR